MFIKICGLNQPSNIRDLRQLNFGLYGFIFVEKSPRNALTLLKSDLQQIPRGKRVAVFVNKPGNEVLAICHQYGIDHVQLHGQESPSDCQLLRSAGLNIIKAFSISDSFDFEVTSDYSGSVDYFLFDTAGKAAGGNGESFNWALLKEYKGSTPFILSGGLGLENLSNILSFRHNLLAGLDFNSKLEISPGLKDIQKCRQINLIKQPNESR